MGSSIYELGEEAGALKSLRRALAIMCEKRWGRTEQSFSGRAELADLETLEAAMELFAERMEDEELWNGLSALLPPADISKNED